MASRNDADFQIVLKQIKPWIKVIPACLGKRERLSVRDMQKIIVGLDLEPSEIGKIFGDDI